MTPLPWARDRYREAVGPLLARAQAAGAVRGDVTPPELMAPLTGASVASRARAATRRCSQA
jgi:hypothetical protein